ncbi:helix-turn-helix domain-containing protein [Hymenobacter arizonensis]|uniref:DNA-binding transcriptional regulator, XRE-family HTH domain n=1 Tax=Hymenobacter arizonensis TaxID=1227077 RepID=A0A1I6BFU3_HYMAR|nr:helix-turn-helix transcriptional regulator [Hymenobacter arizonensis]SFQ79784.1 DNA-binding transcriptional regulator, XRE-family HTH domain [Hymenobacter arizonensis]
MYFAKNLRFLRRRAEWSQSDLGDKIATDYNTISRYESGKSTPKLEALTKLAQVFNVSIEDLRNVDLTKPASVAQVEEPGKDYLSNNRRPTASLPTKPVNHPFIVLIELDGTMASLERAVARLTAVNDVIATTG